MHFHPTRAPVALVLAVGGTSGAEDSTTPRMPDITKQDLDDLDKRLSFFGGDWRFFTWFSWFTCFLGSLSLLCLLFHCEGLNTVSVKSLNRSDGRQKCSNRNLCHGPWFPLWIFFALFLHVISLFKPVWTHFSRFEFLSSRHIFSLKQQQLVFFILLFSILVSPSPTVCILVGTFELRKETSQKLFCSHSASLLYFLFSTRWFTRWPQSFWFVNWMSFADLENNDEYDEDFESSKWVQLCLWI